MAVGEVIDGRFRIERLLGSGGMGRVVLARNLQLDERVALKMLLPEASASSSRRERLLREARAAVKIKSQHVVRIFDVVVHGPHAPYIVMEYLEGESLGARIERDGALPLNAALEAAIQTAEAIGEGHALGIVHRDIKPDNVFALRRPGPPFYKLLDFGISKVTSADEERLTTSQALLASPAYASPEQLRASRDVTEATDIWGLGVLLYQALTGARPFRGESLGQVCTQILQDTPLAPSLRLASVPKALDAVVLRCLEKQPQQRFANVVALLEALAPWAPVSVERSLAYLRSLTDAPTDSSPRPVPVDVEATTATATALAGRIPSRERKGFAPGARRLAYVAAGSALMIAAGWYWSARQAARTSEGVTAGAVLSAPPRATGVAKMLPTPTAGTPVLRVEVPPLSSPLLAVSAGSAPAVSAPAAKRAPLPRRGSAPVASAASQPSVAPVSAPRPAWVESR